MNHTRLLVTICISLYLSNRCCWRHIKRVLHRILRREQIWLWTKLVVICTAVGESFAVLITKALNSCHYGSSIPLFRASFSTWVPWRTDATKYRAVSKYWTVLWSCGTSYPCRLNVKTISSMHIFVKVFDLVHFWRIFTFPDDIVWYCVPIL